MAAEWLKSAAQRARWGLLSVAFAGGAFTVAKDLLLYAWQNGVTFFEGVVAYGGGTSALAVLGWFAATALGLALGRPLFEYLVYESVDTFLDQFCDAVRTGRAPRATTWATRQTPTRLFLNVAYGVAHAIVGLARVVQWFLRSVPGWLLLAAGLAYFGPATVVATAISLAAGAKSVGFISAALAAAKFALDWLKLPGAVVVTKFQTRPLQFPLQRIDVEAITFGTFVSSETKQAEFYPRDFRSPLGFFFFYPPKTQVARDPLSYMVWRLQLLVAELDFQVRTALLGNSCCPSSPLLAYMHCLYFQDDRTVRLRIAPTVGLARDTTASAAVPTTWHDEVSAAGDWVPPLSRNGSDGLRDLRRLAKPFLEPLINTKPAERYVSSVGAYVPGVNLTLEVADKVQPGTAVGDLLLERSTADLRSMPIRIRWPTAGGANWWMMSAESGLLEALASLYGFFVVYPRLDPAVDLDDHKARSTYHAAAAVAYIEQGDTIVYDPRRGPARTHY